MSSRRGNETEHEEDETTTRRIGRFVPMDGGDENNAGVGRGSNPHRIHRGMYLG